MGTCIFEKYPSGYDFRGKLTLNLGCGLAQYKFKNVVNIDAYASCKPDIVWDLEKTPLPFEDNTFDGIIANHILEHLHNWWDCFCECARVLKDGGILEIYVPGIGNDTQLGFRDHVSMINTHSFYGVNDMQRPGSNAWASNQSYNHVNRLRSVIVGARPEGYWWLRVAPKSIKNWMIMHLRNVTCEHQFVFRKMTEKEYNEKRGEEWKP